MPRRSATIAVSCVLLVLLAITATRMSVPYAALAPGPTTDTLSTSKGKPLIQIEGHRTYPTSGHLNLTTVALTDADYRMDLVRALRGWLDPEVAVVPKEVFYPKNQSQKEIQQQNAEEMSLSQQHATTAALRQLGIPVTTQVVVGAVVKDSPSQGKLHAGDQIAAVDGTAVATPAQVRTAVTRHKPGEVVTFSVLRQGKPQQIKITSTRDKSDPTRTVVGIVPTEGHKFPFTVKIQLDDVGGPSAGLMFALGIVDKLNPEEITGGKFIAGTGEIDDDGQVAPIGGIQMKIIAARKAGAVAFLTPKDNCGEALKAARGRMRLIKVSALKDALSSLQALRTGQGDIPGC